MEGVRLIEVSLYLFVWDGLFSTEFAVNLIRKAYEVNISLFLLLAVACFLLSLYND